MPFRWSVRARMTAIAAGNALVLNLVMAVLVTPLVHVVISDYITERVAKAARRVAFNVERYAPVGELKAVTPTEEIDALQVVDHEAKVRQASKRLYGLPPLTNLKPTEDDGRVATTTCTRLLPGNPCLTTVGFRVSVNGDYWMSYAFGPDLPWYVSPLYALGLLGGALVLTVPSSVVAWAAIGNSLRPVKDIKTELAEITATDLGRRVPRSHRGDELDDLARTVNDTLDRLEAAVEQQRRFASDASHDLRSPITAMRAQVEEALLYPDETDWPGTAREVLTSLDRLQAIVGDLLTLARLEAGAPGRSERVDLAELVAAESERPRSKQVATSLEPGVTVMGDRVRLARLLTNLVDNAERHADESITITVRAEGGRAVLEVMDDGEGIAPDQREVVFRRFTRLDASRNRDAGGTGLGLPIAREIAASHEGTLTIEDSSRGARFVVRIPLADGYRG
ncbi:sensor histidine kinase [Nonomuraea sp. NPDC050790]|uniref:sensor histidine kinase n=1 Tax=Nonomuraea sp. NPDC050790 TaxID=3364371 RepID=UPI0037A2EAEF